MQKLRHLSSESPLALHLSSALALLEFASTSFTQDLLCPFGQKAKDILVHTSLPGGSSHLQFHRSAVEEEGIRLRTSYIPKYAGMDVLYFHPFPHLCVCNL